MSKGLKIFLAIFLSLCLIIGISLGNLWSHWKHVQVLENGIEAQIDKNKSNYDAMWKSFTESVQVSKLQASQVKEVYTDLISSRYTDTNVLFKMVTEDNPQLDTKLYTRIQELIESGRATFDSNQGHLTAKVEAYNNYIVDKVVLKIIRPEIKKKNASDYMVLSTKTDNAFETGQDDAINLLGE